MLLKDYYTTLEIDPGASGQEIKRSFRRLVLRFHPDKNEGDAAAAARFREIREAYEILSNPEQREAYNYKRWYNRSLGRQYQTVPVTPQGILEECERLQRYLQAVSGSRVDYDGLSYHIRQLLNEANIKLLQQFGDRAVNQQVVERLIAASAPLPWKYILPIAALMERVAENNGGLRGTIAHFIALHRQRSRWNKYRVPVVLAITLLLCWLIYRISK